jgi:hypothetical protein
VVMTSCAVEPTDSHPKRMTFARPLMILALIYFKTDTGTVNIAVFTTPRR